MNKIKQKSLADKIPILEDNSLQFLISLVKKHNFKSILEVGTGYGYSAHNFASINQNMSIETIEKNHHHYQIATKLLETYSNIKILNYDVLDFTSYQKLLRYKKYDFIFLDGPKKSIATQFDFFINLLDQKGFLVVDNVFLKRLKNPKQKTKQKLKIIKAMEDFVDKILKNPIFNSKIEDVGDGLLIVTKKEIV